MPKPQGPNFIKPLKADTSVKESSNTDPGRLIRSVLVVDPDPDFSSIVSDYLKLFGYNITAKTNIKEAINYSSGENVDVIFLADNFDHHHPIDVLRQFKSAVQSAIIVILANRGDDQLAVELIKSGADDYLSRRVKDKDILTSIASLLEKIARNGSTSIDSRTGIENQSRVIKNNSNRLIDSEKLKTQAQIIEMKPVERDCLNADIVLDSQLGIVEVSAKCGKIFDYTAEEIENVSIETILPKVFYLDLISKIKRIEPELTDEFDDTHFSSSIELVLIAKGGKGIPLKCRIEAINTNENGDKHYLLFFEDLSVEKSHQADLMQQSMWNNLLRSFAHRFINLKLEGFSDELTQVVSETANFFKLDRVSIFLFNKNSVKAKVYLEWLKKGADSLNEFSKKIDIESNLIEFSRLLNGETQRLSPLKTTKDPQETQCLGLSEHYAQVNSVSSMLVPISSKEKVIGWISLDYQFDDKEWNQDETEMFEPLGLLISEAFTRRAKEEQRKVTHQKLSENHGRLSEQAFLDGLTNLANRRYFDKVLESEIRRASREKTNLALLFCDLDYFKNYNDLYGHLEGDNCLKKIGSIFQQEFQRAGDFVARFGGEEFAVILSGSLANDAIESATKLMKQLENASIPNEGSPLNKVTMSIGVSSVIAPKPDDSSRLVENADKALYKAKESGRNRIEVADFSPR